MNNFSIVDIDNDIGRLTIKDESGNIYSLDVNVRSGSIQIVDKDNIENKVKINSIGQMYVATPTPTNPPSTTPVIQTAFGDVIGLSSEISTYIMEIGIGNNRLIEVKKYSCCVFYTCPVN